MNIFGFGGIHHIHKEILQTNFLQLINNRLGFRGRLSVYQYSDMILSKIYTCLIGGDCAEDINYVKDGLQHMKAYQVSSPDTILRLQKELAVSNREVESTSGKKYNFNFHEKLNDLLLDVAVDFDLLGKHEFYTLDFDHQFMPCEKLEAKKSYKMQNGFFPGFATIDNLPILCENRDGNCQVKTDQLSTIKKIFEKLDAHGININRARFDAGSYIQEVINYLAAEQQDVEFYIRANQSAVILQKASSLADYKMVQIGVQKYDCNSFEYDFGNSKHRIVVYRQKNKSGQINLHTGDDYKYLFIITNDRISSEQDIIVFFNQRGKTEKVFDELNNDFNSKHLPFSKLDENTVHLVLSCLTMIVYKWLLQKYSQLSNGILKLTDRIKKFRFRFVNRICFKYVKRNRGYRAKLFIPEEYNLSGFT